MESPKCFYQNCRTFPELVCNCKFPPIISCQDHIRTHRTERTTHMVEKIPANHNLDLRQTEILIRDELYTSQKYFLTPGTEILNYFKFEVSHIALPSDYKNSLNSITKLFVEKIHKIRRGNDEKIKSKCVKYVKAFLKIVRNGEINIKELENLIVVEFNEMHSKTQSAINDKLIEMIEKLRNDKIMLEKHGIIFKTQISEVREKFFEEIMMKAFTLEEILKTFLRIFEKFLPRHEFLINYLSPFEDAYKESLTEISIAYKKIMYDKVKRFYKDFKYMRVAIYRPAVTQSRSEGYVTPEWVIIFNMLLRSEEVQIYQTIEISPQHILILLKLVNQKSSYLLLINHYQGTFLREYFGNDLVLASGSSLYSIILIQNYPRKCFKIGIDSDVIFDIEDISLKIETHHVVTSAVYLSKSNQIICITSSGEIFVQNIGKINMLKPVFYLHPSEKVISAKFNLRKDVLVLRTTFYIWVLNREFKVLYRFFSSGEPIELTDNSKDCLFFYCIRNRKIVYWALPFSEEDLKMIDKKDNVEPGFLQTIQVKVINSLRGRVAEEPARKKDAYYEYVTKLFWPIHIQPEGEIVIGELNEEVKNPLNIDQNIIGIQEKIPIREQILIKGEEKITEEGTITEEEKKGFEKNPAEIKVKPAKLDEKAIIFEELKNPEILRKPDQLVEEKKKFPIPIQEKVPMQIPFIAEVKVFSKYCRLCPSLSLPTSDLCDSTHPCKVICSKSGTCTNTGKLACASEIPIGKISHEGPHECTAGFHSCTARCPMPDCKVYCSKSFQHKGLHKNSMHQSSTGLETCNDFCFARTHKHLLPCKGGAQCEGEKNPDKVKHSEKKKSDKYQCDFFWANFNWEAIN